MRFLHRESVGRERVGIPPAPAQNVAEKVVFVLQQRDLRSAAEVDAVLTHMRQTMLQKIGESCPIFAVSAKQAWEAKHTEDADARARMLGESGFDALENHIASSVTDGSARTEKLGSVCRSAQVIFRNSSCR